MNENDTGSGEVSREIFRRKNLCWRLADEAPQCPRQVRLIRVPSLPDRFADGYALIQELDCFSGAFNLPDRAAGQPGRPSDPPLHRTHRQLG